MHRVLPLAMLILAALATACAPSPQQRTYSVSISNKSSKPITVFLTKNGPPLEEGWLTPAQLAVGPINEDHLIENFKVIHPGTTWGAQNAAGRFDRYTDAVLEIYGHTGRIEDFVAMGLDDPQRVDVVLVPGNNAFAVTSDEKGLVVTPVAPENLTPLPNATSPTTQP